LRTEQLFLKVTRCLLPLILTFLPVFPTQVSCAPACSKIHNHQTCSEWLICALETVLLTYEFEAHINSLPKAKKNPAVLIIMSMGAAVYKMVMCFNGSNYAAV